MSISSVIKSLQDIMRKDAGVDGDAQRLGQLSWLLFLKIFDAQEEALELEQDNYQLPIPQRYLWRTWAANAEGITGDSLLEFVNDDRAKIAKPCGTIDTHGDQHRLNRLGSRQEDVRSLLECPFFPRLRHVAMPDFDRASYQARIVGKSLL